MNIIERTERLYCTPPHIVKALLKREVFPGTIWEPAAGRGDIVRVLLNCGYSNVVASDINDWGFRPCHIENFLASKRQSDCLITNPPFDLKLQFLAQAKQRVRHKIAMLLPVNFEYTVSFQLHHESDVDFRWKAIYAFTQGIRWLNMDEAWGKILMGWFVFERGFRGQVLREKIRFRRQKS